MNKSTINFDEVYPNRSQFETFNAEDSRDEVYHMFMLFFNDSINVDGNDTDFIQYEIERLEAMRDNINPLYDVRTLDGINLYPLFRSGWEATRARSIYITNNCYKFCPEIKEQIAQKYNETGTPEGYFEKLSSLAMEEVARGMGSAKYYLFLKGYKVQPTTRTPEPEPTTQTQETEPPQETPAGKIARILEPLRGAFENPKHIDIIAAGLIEFHKTNVCSIEPCRLFATYEDITDFYKPFVLVWKEAVLTPANIGEVLTRFIFMHNGKREGIAPGTVRKNIYECSRKLEHRNRL